MTPPIEIAGGWYCDNLPTGEFVVLHRNSHITTPFGRVALPSGQNVLQIDLAPDGIRFAGTGHEGPVKDQALEWDGSRWVSHGTAHGPRACIFTRDGRLEVARPPQPPTGSQGFRYVDANGVIVAAMDTREDAVRRIYEYTDRGDVTIGQGGAGPHGEDPVIALYQGRRFVLAEGQCRFIKFRRAGDRLAIAWVQEDRGSAVLLWLDVADLLTYPEQRFAAPADPRPTPTDPKPETPTVRTIPDIAWAEVKRVHAALAGSYSPNEHGAREFMRMLVGHLKFMFPELGFCWKSNGVGAPPSKDCLARQWGGEFFGWDIFLASGHNGPKDLADPPSYHDLTGQTPITDVPARNAMAGDPGDENDSKAHPYVGGDNDTGECDALVDGVKCNRPPTDPVHLVMPRPGPTPTPGPVADPVLVPHVSGIRAAADTLIRLAAQLAAVVRVPPTPPPPAPQEPAPCPLPHDQGLPPHADVMAFCAALQRAYGRKALRLDGDGGHLLFRWLARSHTPEQVEEEARRRGAGTWRDEW